MGQPTHHPLTNNMADRDTKLNKAREKLDKFRKKKKMQEEPEMQPSSSAVSSCTSSPIMFTVKTESKHPDGLDGKSEGQIISNGVGLNKDSDEGGLNIGIKPPSSTESLKLLSSEMSEILAESENFSANDPKTNESDTDTDLLVLLEQEKSKKKEVIDRNIQLETEVENLKLHIEKEKLQFDVRLKEEAFKLKDKLDSKTKAVEFLVSRNAELESNNDSLSNELKVLKQEKCSLE